VTSASKGGSMRHGSTKDTATAHASPHKRQKR
jgi:hypothetical protein